MEKTIVSNCWTLKITINTDCRMVKIANRCASKTFTCGGLGHSQLPIKQRSKPEMSSTGWSIGIPMWYFDATNLLFIPPENPEIPYQPGSWSRSILVYCMASATITTSFGLNGAPVSLHPAIPVAGHWLLTPHKWGKVRKCGKIKGKKSRQISRSPPGWWQ